MSSIEHKLQSPASVSCKIITVSDTRTADTDKSGQLISKLIKEAGHEIAQYEIIPDEEALIKNAVKSGCMSDQVDVILINGGTGIAKRDVTIEAVQSLLEKEIPGFGELF